MPRSKHALVDEPVKLKIPPKECVLCGGKYIPTNNRQKYCPACRELKQQEHDKIDRHKRLAKARETGKVITYTIPVPKKENPEVKMKELLETPERPALPEDWMEEQKKLTAADPGERLYTAEEIVAAVKKFYAGDLVEKQEPVKRHESIIMWLADIRERMCTDYCKYPGSEEDRNEYCATCPLGEI